MNHFKTICAEAMGTHGVFTYKTVHALGIVSAELARWIKSGRISKLGHGTYRITSYPILERVSDAAALLAEIGDGSYLHGESVLGFLGLCPTRSYVAFVATPRRVRRKLPEGVTVVRGEDGYEPAYWDGIPCQNVADAVISCKGTIERERLDAAIVTAVDKGYLSDKEATKLKERIRD